MLIAVCADIHDNVWALARALVRVGRADALIVCGDLCAPFTLAQIAAGFPRQTHVVWGNNDGDKWLLTREAARHAHVHLHGDLAELELDGVRIAAHHYPEIARRLAASGAYDLVCHGHDHTALVASAGSAVLLDPGEVMGRFGRRTVGLFDTATRQAEIADVEAAGAASSEFG